MAEERILQLTPPAANALEYIQGEASSLRLANAELHLANRRLIALLHVALEELQRARQAGYGSGLSVIDLVKIEIEE